MFLWQVTYFKLDVEVVEVSDFPQELAPRAVAQHLPESLLAQSCCDESQFCRRV